MRRWHHEHKQTLQDRSVAPQHNDDAILSLFKDRFRHLSSGEEATLRLFIKKSFWSQTKQESSRICRIRLIIITNNITRKLCVRDLVTLGIDQINRNTKIKRDKCQNLGFPLYFLTAERFRVDVMKMKDCCCQDDVSSAGLWFIS